MQSQTNFIQQAERFSAHNYHPLPIVLSKGEGTWVWDVEGNRYLDCLSAYSAVNQGHRHPRIIAALLDQANKLTLTSRAFHNDQMGAFLEQLCTFSDMDMALPMNTGAEAVETAIKAARKWGYTKKKVPDGQAEIIVCNNNFHGRTTTIVGFSSEAEYQAGFGPFTPGFKRVDFGDAKQLEAAITEHTVAFMVEPIQGEAGILIPPEGYLSEVRKICDEHNVLFIADEIQTGLGRTGKRFAYEHDDNAKPDMLILGKALGGGVYPVSAVLARRDVLGVFKPGDHGSTFGGNPLAAAVGKASLDVIVEKSLSERSEKLGRILMEKLNAINSPHIEEVRGRGLMIAVEIKESSGPARPFCEALMQNGLLAKETHQQVIRLAPPLIITEEDVDFIAEKLKICLQ